MVSKQFLSLVNNKIYDHFHWEDSIYLNKEEVITLKTFEFKQKIKKLKLVFLKKYKWIFIFNIKLLILFFKELYILKI